MLDVTESIFWYWWRIINQAAFRNVLPPPDKVIVRELRGAWGLCEGRVRTDNCIITINDQIKYKRLFIATVAHEMVHQWQWIYSSEGITHGKSFLEWKNFFKRNFGIII